jgi:hypothetical protein
MPARRFRCPTDLLLKRSRTIQVGWCFVHALPNPCDVDSGSFPALEFVIFLDLATHEPGPN